MNHESLRSRNSGKIIAAGHVCLDITPVFPSALAAGRMEDLFVPGKLIRMESASVSTGGCVGNTGLALKALGNDVILMGKIGNDEFGALLQKVLAEHGGSGLIVDDNSSTSYSVVLAVPGHDRMFLHHPGANDTFCASDIPEVALEEASLFHFGYPTLMKQMYENDGTETVELFRRVKSYNVATSLDLTVVDPHSEAGKVDWKKVLHKLLPFVDFFVPSFEELCFMLDRTKYESLTSYGGDIIDHIEMERDVIPLAEQALALGCNAVLIKCGTKGMYYRTGDMNCCSSRLSIDTDIWSFKEGIQPCFKAEIVRSAVGAGDASIAAYLTAIIMGKNPDECARLAAAEGACAVTSYDSLSALKTIPELEEKLASGWELN